MHILLDENLEIPNAGMLPGKEGSQLLSIEGGCRNYFQMPYI
jgi:hypothetical protein